MASRRIIVQLHKNGARLLKPGANLTSRSLINKFTNKTACVPLYTLNHRGFSTDAQDPGFKRVNISKTDNDFINSFGLVMNENDEAISVVLGNQMRRQLWEGCHNEEESRLIKMATENTGHLFFNENMSPEEDFWIKFCSFAPDNTIFPYVFKYDDTAFLPYAFSVDYAEAKEMVDLNHSTNTVDPQSFDHDEVRKQAGIFYASESDIPEYFPQASSSA